MFAALTPEALTAVGDLNAAVASSQTVMIPEDHWIGQLQSWADGLPAALQWLGIILISTIPFVESYSGAPIAVLIGMHPVIAVTTAVVGNMISLIVVIYLAHWIRTAILHRRPQKTPQTPQTPSAKKDRVRRIFERFGVPGVSILGPLALPSQFTAPLLVSFGASRHAVMIWMLVSVILWGVGFALLAMLFISAVT